MAFCHTGGSVPWFPVAGSWLPVAALGGAVDGATAALVG